MHDEVALDEMGDGSGRGQKRPFSAHIKEHVDNDEVQVISVPLPTKKKSGKPKKVVIKAEDKDEGDEGMKNWADSDVETLIASRVKWRPNL